MATSKTLTPTNVTISIPEFTDQPDQRVNSNCIDKEADAINALNSNLGSPSSASAVTGADAFSKINVLNNKADYKITRYLNTALSYGGANVYNSIIQYLEKNEFLLLVEEIGSNKYIFAHVHFVQGTLKDSKTISNNGLDFGATNVNGTQVITGYSGSGAAGTLRWIAW